MNNADFVALENGATVTFNGEHSAFYGIQKGQTLTRRKHWLDDNESVCFSHGEGDDDYHFFSIDEIKE